MYIDLIPTETCSAVCSNLFSMRNYLEVPAASRPEYSKACPSVQDALHYLISSLEENWIASKMTLGFPGGSDGKESACSAGDLGSIPELWRSPGEGNGNPLQHSCLRIPWTEAAYSPWGHKKLGMTEWLTLSLFKMAWGWKLNMLTHSWYCSNKQNSNI